MEENPKIRFHYIKSPSFDEHPLHGIYGGISVQGQIAMAAFSQRMPIPVTIENDLIPVEGEPGAFTTSSDRSEGKDGMIRFVHGVYYFDVEMAKSLRDWLDDKINAIEGMRNDG